MLRECDFMGANSILCYVIWLQLAEVRPTKPGLGGHQHVIASNLEMCWIDPPPGKVSRGPAPITVDGPRSVGANAQGLSPERSVTA